MGTDGLPVSTGTCLLELDSPPFHDLNRQDQPGNFKCGQANSSSTLDTVSFYGAPAVCTMLKEGDWVVDGLLAQILALYPYSSLFGLDRLQSRSSCAS